MIIKLIVMAHGYIVAVIFTVITILEAASGRELIFSNVIWRHGDRSYVNTYPNDPYKDSHIWKNGYGQLTNIGMKQQYQLGQYLRSKYGASLSREYLKDQIHIRSTDKDRTIMSAQSNLAGLYPVTTNEKWNGSATTWHPIPVHVVPDKYEDLLRYPRYDCPKYNETMKKIRSSPWFLEHERKYAEFYKFIGEKTGMQDVNFLNVWMIEDNLFCLQCHNYSLPDWVTEDIMSELLELNSMEMGLMFTDIDYKYRKEISQIQGGILLKKIIGNMQGVKTNFRNYSMIAYSAHDTTLVALLVALGSYDWIQPTYASCIMVDLYKDGDVYQVEVEYRRGNGTITSLSVYGCATSCELNEFVRILKDYVPDDYDKICHAHPESNHALCDEVFVVLSLILFVIVIAIVAISVYGARRRIREHKYSPVGYT